MQFQVNTFLHDSAKNQETVKKDQKKHIKAHTLPICRKLSIYAGTTLKTPEKTLVYGTSASTLHWVPPASVCGAARTPRCCPGKSRQNSTKRQPKLTSQLKTPKILCRNCFVEGDDMGWKGSIKRRGWQT